MAEESKGKGLPKYLPGGQRGLIVQPYGASPLVSAEGILKYDKVRFGPSSAKSLVA